MVIIMLKFANNLQIILDYAKTVGNDSSSVNLFFLHLLTHSGLKLNKTDLHRKLYNIQNIFL